jgi:hypothetical protein
MIGTRMRRLELLLALPLIAGCATTAGWEAGAVRSTDRVLPVVPVDSVEVYYKDGFGVLEKESEKLPLACHSTTLLRRMGLLEGGKTDPPPGEAEEIAELTTEELPRDDERSRITGREFTRVLGIGGDEFELFLVYPSPRATELGIARLKQMAAELGADEVRDVFYTGYAEHQMWEGDSVSLTPTSTDSVIYADIQLLEFRLRDVRFHGTAVKRQKRAKDEE